MRFRRDDWFQPRTPTRSVLAGVSEGQGNADVIIKTARWRVGIWAVDKNVFAVILPLLPVTAMTGPVSRLRAANLTPEAAVGVFYPDLRNINTLDTRDESRGSPLGGRFCYVVVTVRGGPNTRVEASPGSPASATNRSPCSTSRLSIATR